MHVFAHTKQTDRLVMRTALSISHYMSRAVFILVSLWVLILASLELRPEEATTQQPATGLQQVMARARSLKQTQKAEGLSAAAVSLQLALAPPR